MQNLFDKIFHKKRSNFKPDYIRDKSVLIIEPNPWHGEVVPGIVKYFQDIGFNVDIFLRYENNKENPFVNFPKGNHRIFVCTPNKLQQWCKTLDKYEHIFLTTSVLWDCGFMGLFEDWLGYKLRCKGKVMMIEHTPQVFLDEYKMRPFMDRIFSLSEYPGIKKCNPHYFGEFDTSNKKNKTTRFITVGTIHPDAKNHNLLINAAQELIDQGFTDFEISVVGRGNLNIPESLKDKIHLCGRLPYKKMFQKVAQSDFILALLDPENKEHNRYRKGTTSGSLALSLGFNKPLIINQNFTQYYRLTDTNAVSYSDNNLSHAMLTAINMPDYEYQILKNDLKRLQNNVYTESLQNLQTYIKQGK